MEGYTVKEKLLKPTNIECVYNDVDFCTSMKSLMRVFPYGGVKIVSIEIQGELYSPSEFQKQHGWEATKKAKVLHNLSYSDKFWVSMFSRYEDLEKLAWHRCVYYNPNFYSHYLPEEHVERYVEEREPTKVPDKKPIKKPVEEPLKVTHVPNWAIGVTVTATIIIVGIMWVINYGV